MKKKLFAVLLSTMLVFGMFSGCGEEEAVSGEDNELESIELVESEEPESIEEEENHDGMYRSELTNEWIDESLENQRPVAILVDNELTALDHYGLTQADIIYEIMNSTANGEITRFMCIVKDWENITQFGSIRSARPTHFMLAPEYDAVIIHDGGPFYIDAFLKNPWVNNLSGGFARIDNGKSREFTEYVTTGEIADRLERANYSSEYTDYYEGPHWTFASEKDPMDLGTFSDSEDCTYVDLPFPHNGSELEYDEESNTYLYYEYGKAHIDLANDNKQLAFTNLIIQKAVLNKFDENGYMQFNLINESGEGYYITGGKAIPITWEKGTDTEPTKYYDEDGNEIVLNTGKTYIAFVSTERWSELVIK